MKFFYFFLFVLFSLKSDSLQAQTVYLFDYMSLINNQSVQVKALFYQQESGGGFLRTRYKDPVSQKETLIKYDLIEEEIVDADGNTDTLNLFIYAIQPEYFLGDIPATTDTPSFLFSLNPENGYMEPSSQAKNKNAEFKFQQIEAQDMRKAFAQFFQEGDESYDEYFPESTKDIFLPMKDIKVHLLIVADTSEVEVGKSCAHDLKRMLSTMQSICNYSGMVLVPRFVAGKNYNRLNVLAEVKRLKPSSKDVVIFYYSGHGFRKEKDKRPYPYMDLRSKGQSNFEKESLNILDIYSSILKKGARVNLVFSDCCNWHVNAVNAIGTKPPNKKSLPVAYNSNNIKQLFTTKASVLLTAADSSQKASCNLTFGGFCSYYFKLNLESHCSRLVIIPSWNELLRNTKEETIRKAKKTYCDKPRIPQNICNQYPRYEVVK